MDLVYCFTPFFDATEMSIQERQVKWRVCIGFPGLIDERRAGNVDTLHASVLVLVLAIITVLTLIPIP